MSNIGEPLQAAARESSWRRGMSRLRNYFLTGLIIAAPLFLTVYITRTIVGWIDGLVVPMISSAYSINQYLPVAVPGFGLLVALVFITLLGFLTANFVGKRLLSAGKSVLGRMPLIRTVYRGLKQVFETVISRPANAFQQVALIEYPSKGLWSLVFVTSTARGAIASRVGGDDDAVSVFLPKAPNPTNGYLVFVKRSELVILDMTPEEAAKIIISAGLVTPDLSHSAAAAQPTPRRSRKVKQFTPPSAA